MDSYRRFLLLSIALLLSTRAKILVCSTSHDTLTSSSSEPSLLPSGSFDPSRRSHSPLTFSGRLEYLRSKVRDKITWVNGLGVRKNVMTLNKGRSEELEIDGERVTVSVGDFLQVLDASTARAKLLYLLSELDSASDDSSLSDLEKSVNLLNEWTAIELPTFNSSQTDSLSWRLLVLKLEEELVALKTEYDQFRSKVLSVDNTIGKVFEAMSRP